jgi:hypothetical protein
VDLNRLRDLSDFKVDLAIFKENSTCIHKTRPALKDRILHAVGLDVHSKDQMLDWETFLLINKLVSHDCTDKAQQCLFAVKLFDPILGDIVKDTEFEDVVREFFASETELMERRSGRELPPELQDENSLSESTLRDLQ